MKAGKAPERVCVCVCVCTECSGMTMTNFSSKESPTNLGEIDFFLLSHESLRSGSWFLLPRISPLNLSMCKLSVKLKISSKQNPVEIKGKRRKSRSLKIVHESNIWFVQEKIDSTLGSKIKSSEVCQYYYKIILPRISSLF